MRNADDRARRAALKAGLIAKRSRWRRGSIENFGDFMLVDPLTNCVVAACRSARRIARIGRTSDAPQPQVSASHRPRMVWSEQASAIARSKGGAPMSTANGGKVGVVEFDVDEVPSMRQTIDPL